MTFLLLERHYLSASVLTGFARMPPKLAVSKPNSISPTRRQKQENSIIGVIIDHAVCIFGGRVASIVLRRCVCVAAEVGLRWSQTEEVASQSSDLGVFKERSKIEMETCPLNSSPAVLCTKARGNPGSRFHPGDRKIWGCHYCSLGTSLGRYRRVALSCLLHLPQNSACNFRAPQCSSHGNFCALTS